MRCLWVVGVLVVFFCGFCVGLGVMVVVCELVFMSVVVVSVLLYVFVDCVVFFVGEMSVVEWVLIIVMGYVVSIDFVVFWLYM